MEEVWEKQVTQAWCNFQQLLHKHCSSLRIYEYDSCKQYVISRSLPSLPLQCRQQHFMAAINPLMKTTHRCCCRDVKHWCATFICHIIIRMGWHHTHTHQKEMRRKRAYQNRSLIIWCGGGAITKNWCVWSYTVCTLAVLSSAIPLLQKPGFQTI